MNCAGAFRRASGHLDIVDHWLLLVERLDAHSLRASLRREAALRGTVDFLNHCVGPLLRCVGERWESGSLRVAHEHLCTTVVRSFLNEWTALATTGADRGRGRVAIATLPGELHELPLAMVGLVCAASGLETTNLGASCPLDEIEYGVCTSEADAVLLHVSAAHATIAVDRMLRALIERLPEGVDILVGGSGARGGRRGVGGVIYMDDLQELVDGFSPQA